MTESRGCPSSSHCSTNSTGIVIRAAMPVSQSLPMRPEDRGRDTGFGRGEAYAHLAALGQAVVPDGLAVADGAQFLECVQGGLPVGDEL